MNKVSVNGFYLTVQLEPEQIDEIVRKDLKNTIRQYCKELTSLRQKEDERDLDGHEESEVDRLTRVTSAMLTVLNHYMTDNDFRVFIDSLPKRPEL